MEQLDSKALKALSVETRQHIIKLLSSRPYTATEIAKIMKKHVTTISEHLEVLEQAGLVKRKDDGHKWIYYTLATKGEHIFKPQLYSWSIVLSLSIIIVVAGALITSTQLFPEQYRELQEAGSINNAETITKQVPLPPATNTGLNYLLITGTILILAGAGLSIFSYTKKRYSVVQKL